MQYSKVISIKDYADLGIDEKPLRRKSWEIEMALATLNDNGAVKKTSEILGLGAGQEDTIFLLSNQVKRVFATDMYADAGIWHKEASTNMLTNPAACAPAGVEFDIQHIIVQHQNMLDLHYPDNTFHGIFSSGSIEHIGTFEDVLQAAREMGRVLKPGGILSLSTEYKISGPGNGFPGVLTLNEDEIHAMIKATGCELIDKSIDFTVDDETLATAFELRTIVTTGQRPDVEAVLKHDGYGYVFTSIHLGLRKPR